jgi:hypothetical protein
LLLIEVVLLLVLLVVVPPPLILDASPPPPPPLCAAAPPPGKKLARPDSRDMLRRWSASCASEGRGALVMLTRPSPTRSPSPPTPRALEHEIDRVAWSLATRARHAGC